jgi:ABC-type multidrug transport system fused ATPase/permease subunit
MNSVEGLMVKVMVSKGFKGMTIKTVTTVTLYLLSLMLIGIINLIDGQFTPDRLLEPDYWFNTIITNVATLLVLINTINLFLDKYRNNDEVTTLEQTVKTGVYKDIKGDFDDFIRETNKQRKINAFKEKIMDQINQVEGKASSKDLEIIDSDKQELKAKNKVWIKLNRLKKFLDPEYIDRNILFLNVKYNRLTRRIITNNVSVKNDEFVFTNKPLKMISDILPNYMFTFSIILFFTAFVINVNDKVTLAVIMDMVVKLMALIMNFINGISYAKNYTETVVITELQFRLDTIEQYKEWQKKRTETPKIQIELAKS